LLPQPRAGHKIGLFWPVSFHVVNSIAFAHLLPISLALFAKYAPKAINTTIIGLYYLAFFCANTLVGWVGGFYEMMATTNFWLMHAGFAAGGAFALSSSNSSPATTSKWGNNGLSPRLAWRRTRNFSSESVPHLSAVLIMDRT
jgi:predicted permease